MSSPRQREYYRQYMRRYYQEHRDYWRDYYLKKKASRARRSRGSYRSRRRYLERVEAAWFEVHGGVSPLSRLLRRLSRTSIHHFEPHPADSRRWRVGEESRSAEQLRGVLADTLKDEGFSEIRFPAQSSETDPGQTLHGLQAFALKEGSRCIIEFINTPVKFFTKKRREHLKALLNFFEARYFLCFIKPDLSRYTLLELPASNIKPVALGLKAIAAMKPLRTLPG
ncbi:hypothetical protein KEJ39_01445 [Candidatus Bathyarchaeota archaeon]|nr:hypothetical protein [Candidatus Bathyarchaeota archaeon]